MPIWWQFAQEKTSKTIYNINDMYCWWQCIRKYKCELIQKRRSRRVGKKQVKKQKEIAWHRTAQNRGKKAKQRKKRRKHRPKTGAPSHSFLVTATITTRTRRVETRWRTNQNLIWKTECKVTWPYRNVKERNNSGKHRQKTGAPPHGFLVIATKTVLCHCL